MNTITGLIEASKLNYHENFEERKAFFAAQLEASKIINKAIEENDIKLLFAIEREAKALDYKPIKEHSKQFMAVYQLSVLEEYFEASKDTKVLDQRYKLTNKLFGKPTKSSADDFFESPLKAVCKKIKYNLGIGAPEEAKVLADSRIRGIKHIINEHRAIIDNYFGFKPKARSKK